MKKALLIIGICVISAGIAVSAYCVEKTKQASKTAATATARKPMRLQMDKNFVFVVGSISKIDAIAPGKVKIEIVNETDNKSHIIEVTPATNILKVIDAAELKGGEKVRIMAKKSGNDEIAMSVVTGKLKELPKPKAPEAPMAGAKDSTAPSAKETAQVKK